MSDRERLVRELKEIEASCATLRLEIQRGETSMIKTCDLPEMREVHGETLKRAAQRLKGVRS
jgi:hypothetical protein